MLRGSATLILILLAGCATGPAASEPVRAREAQTTAPPDASSPDPAAVVPAPATTPGPDPGPGVEMKQLTEQEWLAAVKDNVSRRLKIDQAEIRVSPARRLLAFVRAPAVVGKKPPKRSPPRRYLIEVVDVEGRRRALFRPVTIKGSDEPPRDLHFLSDDRLVYEVVQPPPLPPGPPRALPPAKKGARRAQEKTPPPPSPVAPVNSAATPPLRRLFIIQPVRRRGRPIRCDGVRFAFTANRDRLAFVGGRPDAAFVAVDGVALYPRRGRTVIASAPAWSKDGVSLAFIEARPPDPARLVLLAEIDNPSGDTTWDLPASPPLEGARVFWSGPDRLVVGKTVTKPAFTASFVKDKPQDAEKDAEKAAQATAR